MKTYIWILLVLVAVICTSSMWNKKQLNGKYIGYTKCLPFDEIDNKIVISDGLCPAMLTIQFDGSFELKYPDYSIRSNKTQDFFCNGKYEIHGDTLFLNSQFKYSDFISVQEIKKDFCNNDVLGIELKYFEYDYYPTYIIDGIKYQTKKKVDTTYQGFPKIWIELIDSNFENDQDHYSVSDSKPSYFRNTRPLQLKFSRFNPSVRNWVYTIKDSTLNYFKCILTPDINGQNLVLENEMFLIADTTLIHLTDSFLEIDTFKLTK